MNTALHERTTLVITSIADSTNAALRDYAQKTAGHGIGYVIAGDAKSPKDFSLEGCNFLSLEQQFNSGFSLARILPVGHYSRKNIGYLEAMRAGSGVIIETDDDNYARSDFWKPRSPRVAALLYENRGWLNAYRLFSKQNIWPRGFDLESINNTPDNSYSEGVYHCPIQQGLADANPDVDAIYRMTQPLPVSFDRHPAVALGNMSWCPFNSQNTTWFKDAFMLMYLPSYCSFRMTDIWRSFVAQRICWANDMRVLFHSATVWQERNDHNLMSDFKDEIPGYLNNDSIAKRLESLSLRGGLEYIPDNLQACYKVFVDMNLIDAKELNLLEAWIDNVSHIMPDNTII
jgi:hypothetical protein